MTTPTLSPTDQIFLVEAVSLVPDQPQPSYLYHVATVLPIASRVGATVRFYKTERRTQLFAPDIREAVVPLPVQVVIYADFDDNLLLHRDHETVQALSNPVRVVAVAQKIADSYRVDPTQSAPLF